uniref:Uncharacterized protein n=1 Tax=Arundo donax TaxID=35708 RepID=A0A0A8YRI5_ARUDO
MLVRIQSWFIKPEFIGALPKSSMSGHFC